MRGVNGRLRGVKGRLPVWLGPVRRACRAGWAPLCQAGGRIGTGGGACCTRIRLSVCSGTCGGVTLGRRQLAEDLLQERYLCACRHLDRLPAEPTRALPWLFTMARLAIDAARAFDTRPVEIGTFNLGAVPTTDNIADRVVDAQIVRTALASLGGQQREVLFETFFADARAEDVARRLGF